ncbi:MAG: ZIP family metal transporter [Candidatus Heimdallarchaeota archaeon]|nr:MAG: ZIP family metal transporter [Candidatus Heimdallarchaeota archaeon]
MFPEQVLAIIYSLIACTATSIGMIIIWKYKEWGEKNVIYFMSFAAGLLLAVSILHIIPESFELNSSAPLCLLVGFLSFHAYDRVIDNHSFNNHDRKSARLYSLGIITAWGIGIHSFIDGVVYMITFSVSMFTGVVTSTAMVFHEIPEGIITFLLLREAGFSEKKSLAYSFLAAAISTPLGAIIAYPFVNNLDNTQLGILLGLSAGALLYVGASRLLPESESGSVKYSLLTLGCGITLAIIIILLGH